MRDYDNVIDFFISSDMESRKKRVVKYYNIPEEKACMSTIEQKDKKRATYYNYYTSRRWGDIANYNMALNCDSVGVDAAVELLADYVNQYEAAHK